MQKKGFTLMEILVVVLIIGVLFSMYSASYSSTKINRKNEKAVAMFLEFANAARLYNEMFPEHKISGEFGSSDNTESCPNCKNPCNLFVEEATDDDTKDMLNSFGLRYQDYNISSDPQAGGCDSNASYDGYEFIICNPYVFDNHSATYAQPIDECGNYNDGTYNMPGIKFAVMKIPNNTAKYGAKYAGKHYWITQDYTLDNDLVAPTDEAENTD